MSNRRLLKINVSLLSLPLTKRVTKSMSNHSQKAFKSHSNANIGFSCCISLLYRSEGVLTDRILLRGIEILRSGDLLKVMAPLAFLEVI